MYVYVCRLIFVSITENALNKVVKQKKETENVIN